MKKKKKNPVKRAIRGGTNQIVPRTPLGRHRWAHTFYTGAKQRSPHVVCFDTLFVFLLVIKIKNKYIKKRAWLKSIFSIFF